MSLKVNTSPNPAKKASEKLIELLNEAKNISVLLMLSGGSAFEILNSIDTSIEFEHVTLSMLDERFSTDKLMNNFAMLAQTEFYKKAIAAGASFLDTRIQDGESLNEAEIRFDYALKSWIRENSGGTILATMGIGEDGHTAGIFPHIDDEKFKYLLEQDDKFVVGYHAHNATLSLERLSVTNHFLREYADHAIVYATGENKREALGHVLHMEGSLAQTPARIIKEMKDAVLFTDIS
jgi:6-phosphogluconolactonase/glucosamine-6-phosphate isomerase/deaminase